MSAEEEFMKEVEEEIQNMNHSKHPTANEKKASETLNSVEDELICPICLEIYIDPTVIGSCLHTFCLKCIKSLGKHFIHWKLTFEGNLIITCPLCKTNYHLYNGAESLKRNFQLQNIIDKLRKEESDILKKPIKKQEPEAPRKSLFEEISAKKNDDFWSRIGSYEIPKSESELLTKATSIFDTSSSSTNKVLEQPGAYFLKL